MTLGLLASEQARHVHGVGPDVHGRATGEIVLIADVGELGEWEAQPGLDPPDDTELTALDDLAHAPGERVVPVVKCLHHDEAGARRDRGDVLLPPPRSR